MPQHVPPSFTPSSSVLQRTMVSPTILSAIAVFFVLYGLNRRRRRARLPPGPARLPLIGNLHQAPTDAPWVTFKKWVEEYGPLISADFGGTNVIIVGSFDIARDLLDKRASIYSSRPRMVSEPFA
jgi:hypothetical protein